MTDPRPREFAAEMLKDLREYCGEWMEKKGVPAEQRKMVMTHVINAAFKAKYRRKAK